MFILTQSLSQSLTGHLATNPQIQFKFPFGLIATGPGYLTEEKILHRNGRDCATVLPSVLDSLLYHLPKILLFPYLSFFAFVLLKDTHRSVLVIGSIHCMHFGI